MESIFQASNSHIAAPFADIGNIVWGAPQLVSRALCSVELLQQGRRYFLHSLFVNGAQPYLGRAVGPKGSPMRNDIFQQGRSSC
jgi:hypothetical protein